MDQFQMSSQLRDFLIHTEAKKVARPGNFYELPQLPIVADTAADGAGDGVPLP